MSEQIVSESAPPPSLAARARQAVVWTTGFNLFRDVLQFGLTLVLVRLLPAEVYGQFGLLTTIIGFLTLLSFREFLNHTLQLRDGETVPYQDHFSAGLVIQLGVFIAANVLAIALRWLPEYAPIAPVLHVMSVLFLLDLPSEFRVRMLERSLDWRRLRLLHASALVAGGVLSVMMAFRGWGVYSLLVPTLLVPIPFAFDLFVRAKWRPTWEWDWARFAPAWRFGRARIAATSLVAGASLLESSWLSWGLGFAALGMFGRAIGLSQLMCGRVAGLLAASVYPVLTRIPAGTPAFRRASAMYLRTTAWVVVPAAAIASLLAQPIVALLYGERWLAIVPLVAYAMATAAIAAVVQTSYTLSLAHGRQDRCLATDAWRLIGTALCLVVCLPLGVQSYLLGLAAVHAVALVGVLSGLIRDEAITTSALADAFVPPMASATSAIFSVGLFTRLVRFDDGGMWVSVTAALLFVVVFGTSLRLFFQRELSELVGYLPEPQRITRWLRLQPAL